jgi:hypothetical protein
MTVQLNPYEMLAAKNFANLRMIANRANAVANAKMGPQSDDETDLIGIIAEIAWAKWKNVYFDVSISPRAGSYDNVTQNERVDIKATTRPNGRLLATAKKKHEDVDVFVLGIVQDTSTRFVGWAYRSELICDKNLTNLGYGPTYALDQNSLHSFTTTTTA